MIEVDELTKRYGARTVVDALSFAVRPGRVTGFLGPNGAGKTTTLRMALGLCRPSEGAVRVMGRPLGERARALTCVGALLDAGDAHGGRSAVAHLRALARSNGVAQARVDEVLDEVGLADAARRRVGGFSLGMRQRLGIAGALLGDPPVVVFDEPLNGLDPEGVRWVRGLFRRLAGEGRTVLVSSHLMGEMEHTADDLVVIGRGRLIAAETLAAFAARGSGGGVWVRVDDPAPLARVFAAEGVTVRPERDGGLLVSGIDAGRVGELAAGAGLVVRGLAERSSSLEDVFMELTADSVEYGTERKR
ncbi:ATP-binding cassette domain-containing protein [Streptomyces avicenniae]|uniref:ATP-binding cassette domain-containing protein n=1 Tax=Streptomyces avicenniae TaxID=500153 RepID=UPI00069B19B4|nr:ATP-binding cassette domain-containing protein [Streptomyces avicenniae]